MAGIGGGTKNELERLRAASERLRETARDEQDEEMAGTVTTRFFPPFSPKTSPNFLPAILTPACMQAACSSGTERHHALLTPWPTEG